MQGLLIQKVRKSREVVLSHDKKANNINISKNVSLKYVYSKQQSSCRMNKTVYRRMDRQTKRDNNSVINNCTFMKT